MADVSNGGQSTSDEIGRASTRPRASASGTNSPLPGEHAPATIASASSTVIMGRF